MTPKNDKARKQWLAGLKDGDEAAWLDGNSHRIGTIRRDHEENEIKFIRGGLVNGWFTSATGKGVRAECTTGWLVPATEEIKAREAKREAVLRLRQRLTSMHFHGSEITDDQILGVSAILWPEVK